MTASLAQIPSEDSIKIAIIPFRYENEIAGIQKNMRWERNVIIPAILRVLERVGTRNYMFEIIPVISARIGETDILEPNRVKGYVYNIDHDIAIWGQIKPLNKALSDYNLHLIVLTNSSKYSPCTYNYDLEIRDTRIVRWNYQSCDLSEWQIGVVPSFLCYAMSAISDSTFSIKKLSFRIKEKLLLGKKNLLKKIFCFGIQSRDARLTEAIVLSLIL